MLELRYTTLRYLWVSTVSSQVGKPETGIGMVNYDITPRDLFPTVYWYLGGSGLGCHDVVGVTGGRGGYLCWGAL